MRTFLHRFIWKDKDTRFVPFLVFFSLQTLTIGLLFLFGAYIPGVSELPLFHILDTFLPPGATANVWGGSLVLVFVGHCLEMYYRGRGFGPAVGMSGFLLWTYALYVYLEIFYIMGIVAICAPQLFFWGWYYFESKNYRREQRLLNAELNHT